MFIVSGDGPRCGSSAMMRALIAGGLEAVYHNDATEIEGQQYELNLDYVNPKGFPQACYFGKLIKAFPWPWTPFMEQVGYLAHHGFNVNLVVVLPSDAQIVWLHRPPEERWRSFAVVDPNNKLCHSPVGRKFRDACAELVLETMRISLPQYLTEIEQSDLRDRPAFVFKTLKDRGWPIDIDAAAEAVKSGATKS